MILSQKITKWCLFGAFFLFMPSLYLTPVVAILFTPIHMVSFMFMSLTEMSRNFGASMGMLIWTALYLAIYLALYYQLSIFLARMIFSIAQAQTRQTLIAILLASIGTIGSIPDYGPLKNHRRLSDHYSWLQMLQYSKEKIKVSASPMANIAPGIISLHVDTKSIKQELIAWDLDEDGETGIQGPHEYRVNHTYKQPGIYHPRVVVTDQEGTTFEEIIEMHIHDRVEFVAKLNTLWRALWPALGNKDEENLKQ